MMWGRVKTALQADSATQLIRFAAVGASGVVVNNLVLYLLHGAVGWPLVPASMVAVEVAIVNNFIWNDRWTFSTRDGARYRFLRFNLVSLGGLVINTGVLAALVAATRIHYLLANLVAIGAAMGWNFSANARWTWIRGDAAGAPLGASHGAERPWGIHGDVRTVAGMEQTPSISRAPQVLVSAASKYGSTAEIAARIGEVLGENGCSVTLTPPEEVGDLASFDAIVLGSAVYMGRWRKDARKLAERIDGQGIPVWLFSSGPLGDPPKPAGDPVDIAEILALVPAVEHVVFAGKVDKASLSFPDRAVINAVKAPEGDFRNWAEIAGWARRIADRLLDVVITSLG